MTKKEIELIARIRALGADVDSRPIYTGTGWTAFEEIDQPFSSTKHHFPDLEAVIEWLINGNECYFAFAGDWTIVKGNLC